MNEIRHKEHMNIGQVCIELEQSYPINFQQERVVLVDDDKPWLGIKGTGVMEDYSNVGLHSALVIVGPDSPQGRELLIKQIQNKYLPESDGSCRFFVWAKVPDPKGKKKRGVLELIYPRQGTEVGAPTKNTL